MRKYHQLILVIISVISVSVLIVYRSENERLNNVLNVINFFGNRDAINLVKIENFSNFSYRFDYPLPSFVNLDNGFYAYSGYWKKNDLVAGGEAISLVVASLHANVQYQCKVHFSDNSIANGKFSFMRVEHISEISSDKFLVYKFLCKTQKDYGAPKNLIFINTETKSEQYVPIRQLTIKNRSQVDKSLVTVCLDLNSYNRSFTDEFTNDINTMQYFLYHELIGIRNYIIYNSNVNQMNQNIVDLLTNKYGIRLNILPYNFPFQLASKSENRAIIEADCLLRSSGLSKYVMITSLNEYLMPSVKLSIGSPLIKMFNHYSNEISQFEISSKAVCTDGHKKVLSDNERYSVDIKNRIFYIIKNEYPYNDRAVNDISKKSIEVDRSLAVVHKYITCSSKSDVYEWRTTMDEKHLQYIDFVSKELNKLLVHP